MVQSLTPFQSPGCWYFEPQLEVQSTAESSTFFKQVWMRLKIKYNQNNCHLDCRGHLFIYFLYLLEFILAAFNWPVYTGPHWKANKHSQCNATLGEETWLCKVSVERLQTWGWTFLRVTQAAISNHHQYDWSAPTHPMIDRTVGLIIEWEQLHLSAWFDLSAPCVPTTCLV